MKTYDELNLLSIEELQKLKEAELARLAENESIRQRLIVDVLTLQNFKGIKSMRKAP